MTLFGDRNDHSEVTGRILFVFAVLNIVAFALCYFLVAPLPVLFPLNGPSTSHLAYANISPPPLKVPETSGATISKSADNPEYMSLEELNYIFATPTSKHVKYQTKVVLPWAINKVIPGRPHEPPPDPLHRWARDEGKQEEQQAQTQTEMRNGIPHWGDTDSLCS